MRSLMRGIHRLQAVIPPLPPPKPKTEADRKWSAAIAILLDRMDPAHARLVREDLKNVRRDYDERYCDFTVSALIRVMNHITENQPLEFPPEVAAIYL